MLRALLVLLRHGVSHRCATDDAPNASFSLTHAAEDTPPDESPAALSARLDAIEAMLDDRDAVHRLKAEAALARLSQESTHRR